MLAIPIVLSQEPPTPIQGNMPDILPNPIILIAIVIVIAGVIAWIIRRTLNLQQ